mmetsp:Transcript_16873/g.31026  ORF Transcript_16873/g.31026 Transcript_16873/m.31026 type:complete len:201 (-) Transcript_16873:172-774(-)
MSPGTNSLEGISTDSPSRTTRQLSGCMSFSASRLFSALLSWYTPTIALRIRISRITRGSTNCEMLNCSPFSYTSLTAMSAETTAATSRILTSGSSNCSSTISQKLVPSSLGSSLNPNVSRFSLTSFSDSPFCTDVPSSFSTTSTSLAHGASMATTTEAFYPSPATPHHPYSTHAHTLAQASKARPDDRSIRSDPIRSGLV